MYPYKDIYYSCLFVSGYVYICVYNLLNVLLLLFPHVLIKLIFHSGKSTQITYEQMNSLIVLNKYKDCEKG